MTATLLIALLLVLALLVRQRRVCRRRYGALICEHRHELTKASMRGKLAGVKAAELAQEKRMGRDWQEASR